MISQGFHQKGICQFIWKLREMINKHSDTINWTQCGKQVVVISFSRLEQNVLPWFFRHSNFASFVRQLNMYGFCKTLKEDETFIFNHDIFWRGNDINYPSIQRKTKPRTQKYLQARFSRENCRILKKIEDNITMGQTVKETIVSLLQYKDRISDNLKKMKRMLQKICYQLKDTRLKKVITCVQELKTDYIKNLENQICEAKQLQGFIETKILLQEKKITERNSDQTNDKKILISHFSEQNFLNFVDQNDDVSLMNHRDLSENQISRQVSFGEAEDQQENEIIKQQQEGQKKQSEQQEVQFDFN